MTTRHFLTVVNPRGGTRRGLAILGQVRPLFAAADIKLDVHATQYAGHAREIVARHSHDGYDGLCVIGGDGTIHEAANGLIAAGPAESLPLGVIPAGSGNTMHQHLGLGDPAEAVRRIVAGRTCPLDVARVTTGGQVLYCVDIIGWGAVADINRTAERLRFMGPPRYAAAALWHILRAKRRPAVVTLDGQRIEDEFLFVIGCNTRFTGKGMQLAPRAEIDDGRLDVIMVRRAARGEMLKLFRQVFAGSHLALPYVEYRQVQSLTIDASPHDQLDLDGELRGAAPVGLEMLPKRLKIFA